MQRVYIDFSPTHVCSFIWIDEDSDGPGSVHDTPPFAYLLESNQRNFVSFAYILASICALFNLARQKTIRLDQIKQKFSACQGQKWVSRPRCDFKKNKNNSNNVKTEQKKTILRRSISHGLPAHKARKCWYEAETLHWQLTELGRRGRSCWVFFFKFEEPQECWAAAWAMGKRLVLWSSWMRKVCPQSKAGTRNAEAAWYAWQV